MSVDNKNTFSPNQTSPSAPVPAAARRHLRASMARHEEGDIEGALAEARAALELAPQFADARSYIGSTLITKQGRYAEGLAVDSFVIMCYLSLRPCRRDRLVNTRPDWCVATEPIACW